LELSRKEHQELFDYCKEKGIIFLSTPYDEKSADLLENLGVEAYKIGSGELTHIPLLKHVASKGKPMIISTGGSFLEEVKDAVGAVKSEGNDQMVLLHCTSLYPTPLNQVNLNQMLTLSKEFGLEIGYSDHTLGIEVSLTAIALGACVIERHFTLDRNLPGPDHKASLEPKELKEMIKGSVEIEKRVKAGENPMAIIKELGVEEALGSAVKEPVQKEFVERDLGCRSVVARKDIAPGVLITEQMLAVKRPGTGIKPKDIYKIFNKKAKREIKKDQLLSWEDLE
jgi:sialic acid synthase SpsE